MFSKRCKCNLNSLPYNPERLHGVTASCFVCFIFAFASCFKKHISPENQWVIELRPSDLPAEEMEQDLELAMHEFPTDDPIRGFWRAKSGPISSPCCCDQKLGLPMFLLFDQWSPEAQFMMTVVIPGSHILCMGPALHSCCFSAYFLHLKATIYGFEKSFS